MEKARVGIIGTGGISHAHMTGYKAIPDRVDVAAVCDIDEEKVKAYATKFNVPRWYTDYNEMLAKENLDAVSVTTWNAAHKGAAIAAMRAGANVICEKPMAMNAVEAQEMYDVSKETGKVLQIGFVRRYGADAAMLKKFIDAGTLGDIYYAKATYLRRSGCPGGWFGDIRYSGGGPLIDLGVHVMDLVRYLAGCPKPVSAYGVTYNNLGPDRASGAKSNLGYESNQTKSKYEFNVEDFTSAMIRFDNGMTLTVEASFNLNIKQDRGDIELFGTKGGTKITDGAEFFTDMNGEFINITPASKSVFEFTPSFNAEIAHFIDCVQNGVPCRAPAEDGVILMKMIDAIYESARTGHEALITY
ncbi:MAG: Gfo/Idh/MocA family oxidoreductase [Clostridia bacterium]|nr:Gfo/Idh/MocA family oxidoreductase [Clostridia bacterium]